MGTTLLFPGEVATDRLREGPITFVSRRGPILRASPVRAGVYGLDLTAGCDHACPFCHIQGSSRYPGAGKVLFDPKVVDRLSVALDALEMLPDRVVLSPASDPFPAHRAIREAAEGVIDALLSRGIGVVVMTRGRLSRRVIGRLAQHPKLARVVLPLTTLDRSLSRRLEPRAASPRGRLRSLARLSAAGVPVEVRLEPMIAGLTDTAENLRPLFAALAHAGVDRVLAHYLFVNGVTTDRLSETLAPLGWSERLGDSFAGGPVFPVGTLGTMKHLPKDARQVGLARLATLGAEFGLAVETGPGQNPDLLPLLARRTT